MISENLPRRTGLSAHAGPGKGFEWRGVWASIVISENLPCRTGRAQVLNGPLEAEAGIRTGSWEGGGRRDRMFNHWAVGLRSGLLPEGCGVATPEIASKKRLTWAKFSRGFWVPGDDF